MFDHYFLSEPWWFMFPQTLLRPFPLLKFVACGRFAGLWKKEKEKKNSNHELLTIHFTFFMDIEVDFVNCTESLSLRRWS